MNASPSRYLPMTQFIARVAAELWGGGGVESCGSASQACPIFHFSPLTLVFSDSISRGHFLSARPGLL